MSHINYNGKILPEGTPLFEANSRATRYGDGIFETLKLKNNRILFADEHFARLWKGMQLLKFEVPRLFSPEKLHSEILQLTKKNNHTNSRIRVAIYRGNGGLYDTTSHTPGYVIQTWPLAEDNGHINQNGLQVCFYRNAVKPIDNFSNLKHNNYLPYFMGALFAREQKCNDALIFNTQQRICDSTIANVFIIKNNSIFTPPLSEGCIAGVMRKFLLKELPIIGFDTAEKTLTEDDLESADEIFLTNSIYNIRWVAGLGNNTFTNQVTLKIDAILRQTNPETYC